jgi:hypothetical protein
MCLDLADRGIDRLYAAARVKTGTTLSGAAAAYFSRVPPGSFVLIGTGWLTREWVSPRLAENDGPPGAAAVARALWLARDVTPVVVAEDSILSALAPVFRASGLSVLTLEEARRTKLPGGKTAAVVLEGFPTDDAEAERAADRLLDDIQPTLCFATERASRAKSGVYHNARGVDISAGQARIDLLFEVAMLRGIPTIGVGDGGNEIGMGSIADAVASTVRFGEQCACSCGSGVGARTATDVLVTANCSNWGCYATVAAFAIAERDPRLLHTPEREGQLLQAATSAGLLNSPRGTVDPNVDDIPLATHQAIVELMREVAVRAIAQG